MQEKIFEIKLNSSQFQVKYSNKLCYIKMFELWQLPFISVVSGLLMIILSGYLEQLKRKLATFSDPLLDLTGASPVPDEVRKFF